MAFKAYRQTWLFGLKPALNLFENLENINTSVDGKRCYYCEMPHRTPADECGNFEVKKQEHVKRKRMAPASNLA